MARSSLSHKPAAWPPNYPSYTSTADKLFIPNQLLPPPAVFCQKTTFSTAWFNLNALSPFQRYIYY
jgi:hypothetical protein